MKKVMSLAFVAAIMLSFGTVAIAANHDIPVISVGEACLDEEHVHEEDVAIEPNDRLQLLRNEPHCGSGSRSGILVTKIAKATLGTDTRNCTHGNERKLDRRYQYQTTINYSCTRCAYTYVATAAAYGGTWSCLN